MKKTITLNVPNELWVNDYSENKTAKFVYDGPSVIWVLHTNEGNVIGFSEQEPEDSNKMKVDIAAATPEEIAVAIFAVSMGATHEYIFEDETNYDGSVHKKITNPRVSDYFRPVVLAGKPQLDTFVKDPNHANMEKAVARKKYVEKYLNTYSFEGDEQTQLNAFMTSINAYIDTIKTAYPWKFVSVNEAEIPKIPVSVVKLLNQLPDPSL
jgi:hypothetical protein